MTPVEMEACTERDYWIIEAMMMENAETLATQIAQDIAKKEK